MASDLKTSHHPFALKITYVAMGVVFLIGFFSSFGDSLFPASLDALAALTSAHLHEAIAVLLLTGIAWTLTERWRRLSTNCAHGPYSRSVTWPRNSG